MASPSANLIFAMAMAIMGFTMLGYGNLSWLQNLGNKVGGSSHSKSNAFWMGMGAGLVASPCTGPILAFLLAVASRRQNLAESALLLAVYSFGFALPYVFLGAFSAKVSKKRFSPRVQVAVKTLFAGIIFSVALLYLKIPLVGLWSHLEPYTLQLGRALGLISLAMFALILISRNLFERKSLHILPALMAGVAIFCLFESRFSTKYEDKIAWITAEEEAYQIAKSEDRPILVDTWAEWCIACKKMEKETFMDPKIRKEFSDQNWVLLKLDLTEANDLTDAIQEKYGIQSLPTVTIIPRGGIEQFDKKRTLVGYQDVESLFQEIIKERPSP
jgi:thiol:disulfide interchange protein DsbD